MDPSYELIFIDKYIQIIQKEPMACKIILGSAWVMKRPLFE